ncbi:MAG: ATP12 family protein [Xanthobacteraceae bacterium]|jgi:chaperone required for assembly of F1-ATPase
MRDTFEKSLPENAVEAVRRATRPVLRRRFYGKAGTAAAGESFAVRLDDKPVHTPAGRILAAPTLALAEAIAAEWDGQRDTINPAKMPLTRLANVIIDGVSDRPGPVAAEIQKYLATDLVCYRAAAPPGLVDRQARHWDPIVVWTHDALGAHLRVGEGVIHVVQPEAALAAAGAAIPDDPWRLGAVHTVTTLTGSALIALALLHARLTADEAWQAAHVDEDWNMAQWGRDEIALSRRAFHFTELQAAALVLQLLAD